jgi:hypothetical protein
MALEIQVFACDRNKKMADLHQLMGSRLFPLDNWISNGNTGINQRLNELHIYSQTCIKRSLFGQRKSGLIRHVTS